MAVFRVFIETQSRTYWANILSYSGEEKWEEILSKSRLLYLKKKTPNVSWLEENLPLFPHLADLQIGAYQLSLDTEGIIRERGPWPLRSLIRGTRYSSAETLISISQRDPAASAESGKQWAVDFVHSKLWPEAAQPGRWHNTSHRSWHGTMGTHGPLLSYRIRGTIQSAFVLRFTSYCVVNAGKLDWDKKYSR